MFVITRACPVHRDFSRNRTCKRLTDRRSTIKAMGQLAHSVQLALPDSTSATQRLGLIQPFSGLEVHNFTSATRRLAAPLLAKVLDERETAS